MPAIKKDSTDQESISHLREVLAEFGESAAIATARAKSWKKQAYLITGRTWVVHEEDGSPLAVLVALTDLPPYRMQHVKDGLCWALFLNVPLSICAADQAPVNIPADKLVSSAESWRPYVGPKGLVLDLARNVAPAGDGNDE